MARKSRKNINGGETSLPSKVWRTAIYARLSCEDNNIGVESESIETQIAQVEEYIKIRPHFNLIDTYVDNGYSGSNFNRPEFERLMEDIRNRQIDCIIVKDLSRFAREHIGAEDYLNNIFPFLGIRFIAIRDGYDNINMEPQEHFMASFKNFANSYFAKETSRKTSETKRRLQEEGKFIGSRPPYGYKRDSNDKHKLIIDEEKAKIVREIFERSASGERPCLIVKDLNERKIPTATNSKWTNANMNILLNKDLYLGILTQRRRSQALYKNEAPHDVPKEKQIRIENAFPAIIERELWDRVQENFKKRAIQYGVSKRNSDKS